MWGKAGDDFSELGRTEPTRGSAGLPPTDMQQAWFELTRAREWRSVALVPVEDTYVTLSLAHELAQMASLDLRNRVLVVNATGAVGSEVMSKMPPPAAGSNGALPVASGKYALLDCAKLGLDDATIGMVEVPKHLESMRAGNGPFNMMIVATNCLMTRPPSVATARAVDIVVLCPILGVSNFRDSKRTIELIGEEHVAGSIVVR